MQDDDTSLDELLAAAAPVTDSALDRPHVRDASRALVEELTMTVPTSNHRITDAGGRSPGRGDGERTDVSDASAEPAVETVVLLRRPAPAPPRRGRLALAATAAAAVVVAVGLAFHAAGDPGGGTPAADTGVAGPGVPEGAPAPDGPPGEAPSTACEWTAAWFAADDADDADARNQAVAGLAELAAQAFVAGDELMAVRIEATMSPMSAGHREAAEGASATLGC